MQGRQVFNFAASNVPKQISELLLKTGLSAAEIDLFVLHQGSKYIVETIAKRLKLPQSKVPVMLSKTGNTSRNWNKSQINQSLTKL